MKTIYTFLLLFISCFANAQVEFIKKCGIVYNGSDYMMTNGTQLFFGAEDSTSKLTPWISDGTAGGTHQITDTGGISPSMHIVGGRPKSNTLCTVYKNEFYFLAEDKPYEEEVWKTDGTPAGTHRLTTINPHGSITGQYYDSYPYFTELNGILYFAADDGTHGSELWRTDGTDTGTHMVKDIYAGYNPSTPEHLTLFKNAIYFDAWGENYGTEVWKTDGTTAGTQMLKDIRQGLYSCWYTGSGWLDPYFKASGNYLYFWANIDSPDTHFYEWRTDGITQGTLQLGTAIAPLFDNEYDYADLNGTLFFYGSDGNNDHSDICISDGSVNGTVNITSPSPVVNYNGEFFPFKNKMYFDGTNGFGYGLCVSDGTPVGTSVVKTFQGLASNPGVGAFATDGNYLYGGVLEQVSSNEMDERLFQSDGTPGGTTDIKHYGFSGGLIQFKGKMYYAGYDSIIDAGYDKPGLYAFTAINVGVNNINEPIASVQIFPNPFSSAAIVNVKGLNTNGCHLLISNVLGQVTANYPLTGESTIINRGSLTAGIYFCQVVGADNKKVLATGKLMVAE